MYTVVERYDVQIYLNLTNELGVLKRVCHVDDLFYKDPDDVRSTQLH